jgi:hypothetical protein
LCGIALTLLNRKQARQHAGLNDDEECGLLQQDAVSVDEEHATLDENSMDEEKQSMMPEGDDSTMDQTADQSTDTTDERVRWTDMKKLPLNFWLLCTVVIFLYGAVNPFIHILSEFLQNKWYPNDVQTAGAMMAIPDLISAIGTYYSHVHSSV